MSWWKRAQGESLTCENQYKCLYNIDLMIPELSVVIPVRNESPNIDELYRELTEALERWGRATRSSWSTMAARTTASISSADGSSSDERWRIIRFRRNFGQTAAFSAGFREARGRLIATSDGDLQNDPAIFPP